MIGLEDCLLFYELKLLELSLVVVFTFISALDGGGLMA